MKNPRFDRLTVLVFFIPILFITIAVIQRNYDFAIELLLAAAIGFTLGKISRILFDIYTQHRQNKNEDNP